MKKSKAYYLDSKAHTYKNILRTSTLPIEYQFLVQEYEIKLSPFFIVAKYYYKTINDIIMLILKLLYNDYLKPFKQCCDTFHYKSLKYAELSYKYYKKGTTSSLKEYEKMFVKCEVCILKNKCKFNGIRKCKMFVFNSNYCKEHMNCESCSFNRRICECNIEGINTNKYHCIGVCSVAPEFMPSFQNTSVANSISCGMIRSNPYKNIGFTYKIDDIYTFPSTYNDSIESSTAKVVECSSNYLSTNNDLYIIIDDY